MLVFCCTLTDTMVREAGGARARHHVIGKETSSLPYHASGRGRMCKNEKQRLKGQGQGQRFCQERLWDLPCSQQFSAFKVKMLMNCSLNQIKLAINEHYKLCFKHHTLICIFFAFSAVNLLFLWLFCGSIEGQSKTHREVNGISLNERIKHSSLSVARYSSDLPRPPAQQLYSCAHIMLGYVTGSTIQLCNYRTHLYLAKWVPE